MQKPRDRSKTVDEAIKAAYAKLANAHFKRAEASIGSTADIEAIKSAGIVETTVRMEVVEDYLERAGAAATKWNFRP